MYFGSKNYSWADRVEKYIVSTVTRTCVYRSTVADASSRAIDPMTFDLTNVNQGSLYNSNNGIVTISTSGYYYVYISAGARQQTVSLLPVRTL